MNNIPQWEGKPRDKIPPVLEPMNLAEMENREHLLVGLARSADPSGVGKLDFDAITESDRNLSKNMSTALLLKEHSMASALYVVDALVHAGLLKVMTPEARAIESRSLIAFAADGANAAPAVLTAIKSILLGDAAAGGAVEKTDVSARTGLNFTDIDLDNPTAVKTKLAYPEALDKIDPAKLPAAEKTTIIKELTIRKERSLLWLSSILGLTKTMNGSRNTSRNIQNIVLRGLYPASFEALENDTRNIPRLPTLLNASTSISEKKLISNYAKTARSFQLRYRLVLAELQYSVTRRYIGKSLSHVKPGPNVRVDLLLTTRQ